MTLCSSLCHDSPTTVCVQACPSQGSAVPTTAADHPVHPDRPARHPAAQRRVHQVSSGRGGKGVEGGRRGSEQGRETADFYWLLCVCGTSMLPGMQRCPAASPRSSRRPPTSAPPTLHPPTHPSTHPPPPPPTCRLQGQRRVPAVWHAAVWPVCVLPAAGGGQGQLQVWAQPADLPGAPHAQGRHHHVLLPLQHRPHTAGNHRGHPVLRLRLLAVRRRHRGARHL